MSSHRAIEVRSGGYRAVATLNGRTKCSIYLYEGVGAGATALSTVDINPADDRARARAVATVAEEHRDAISQLLLEVAQAADIERTKPVAPKSAPTTVFAAIEPWEQPVDAVALLDDLVALVARYVVMPQHALTACVLWLLHTYVADVADYTPYLHVNSPVRSCGKSTLLDLLEPLAFRGQKTDGITAAALYRRIDRLSPSMLLDELDARLHGDGGELLRGVLNSGFHRGGKVTLCVGDDIEDRDFNTFSPKVLAGIGRLWDTVQSRSIPIRMERATSDELKTISKLRGDKIASLVEPYRRRLQRWANDIREELRESDAQVPEELSARQGDVWRQLFAIADAAAATWGERARSAALALHGFAEAEGDWGLLALEDLRDLFAANAGLKDGDKLTSEQITESFAAMEHRPWPEFKNGKPISKGGLAKLLGRFESGEGGVIKPRSIRLEGKTPKGYLYADCLPAFTRYLPHPLSAPQHPQQRNTPSFVAVVADKKEGTPQEFAEGFL